MFARLASALGLSLRHVGGYRPHLAHMAAPVLSRPHAGDYWTQLPSGERIFAATRAALVAAMAARGVIPA